LIYVSASGLRGVVGSVSQKKRIDVNMLREKPRTRSQQRRNHVLSVFVALIGISFCPVRSLAEVPNEVLDLAKDEPLWPAELPEIGEASITSGIRTDCACAGEAVVSLDQDSFLGQVQGSLNTTGWTEVEVKRDTVGDRVVLGATKGGHDLVLETFDDVKTTLVRYYYTRSPDALQAPKEIATGIETKSHLESLLQELLQREETSITGTLSYTGYLRNGDQDFSVEALYSLLTVSEGVTSLSFASPATLDNSLFFMKQDKVYSSVSDTLNKESASTGFLRLDSLYGNLATVIPRYLSLQGEANTPTFDRLLQNAELMGPQVTSELTMFQTNDCLPAIIQVSRKGDGFSLRIIYYGIAPGILLSSTLNTEVRFK